MMLRSMTASIVTAIVVLAFAAPAHAQITPYYKIDVWNQTGEDIMFTVQSFGSSSQYTIKDGQYRPISPLAKHDYIFSAWSQSSTDLITLAAFKIQSSVLLVVRKPAKPPVVPVAAPGTTEAGIEVKPFESDRPKTKEEKKSDNDK